MARVFVRSKPEQFCTCTAPKAYSSNPDYCSMTRLPKGLWFCAECGWPTVGGWKGYLASRKQ